MAGLTPATGDFLARLVRLDPASLIRVRGPELWSRVPWNVLVTCATGATDAGAAARDVTVSAAGWLALGTDDPSTLERLDAQWRISLPSGPIVVRETMPIRIVRRVSVAAAETLRETESSGLRGRAVGARALRDALLDHVPIIVAAEPADIRVPQRVVQAVARLGFLGAEGVEDEATAQISTCGPWVGIATARGAAWWRAPSELQVYAHRA
jgi:hypothetical protein